MLGIGGRVAGLFGVFLLEFFGRLGLLDEGGNGHGVGRCVWEVFLLDLCGFEEGLYLIICCCCDLVSE